MYKIFYSTQAQKDAKKANRSELKDKIQSLLEIIKEDPFKYPPSYEPLLAEAAGTFSRRINSQHRLVYQVYEKEKIVKVIRMWTHYE